TSAGILLPHTLVLLPRIGPSSEVATTSTVNCKMPLAYVPPSLPASTVNRLVGEMSKRCNVQLSRSSMIEVAPEAIVKVRKKTAIDGAKYCSASKLDTVFGWPAT